jgi:hypothetical protein
MEEATVDGEKEKVGGVAEAWFGYHARALMVAAVFSS